MIGMLPQEMKRRRINAVLTGLLMAKININQSVTDY